MTGTKYKKLRAESNTDDEIARLKDKHIILRKEMLDSLQSFCFNEDLFHLITLMKAGATILEDHGFPMKEFALYKFNAWTKNAKKKS